MKKKKITKLAFMAIALMACSFKGYASFANLDPNDPNVSSLVNKLPAQPIPNWNWLMANNADFKNQYNGLVSNDSQNSYLVNYDAFVSGYKNVGQITWNMSDDDFTIMKYVSTAVFFAITLPFPPAFLSEAGLTMFVFQEGIKEGLRATNANKDVGSITRAILALGQKYLIDNNPTSYIGLSKDSAVTLANRYFVEQKIATQKAFAENLKQVARNAVISEIAGRSRLIYTCVNDSAFSLYQQNSYLKNLPGIQNILSTFDSNIRTVLSNQGSNVPAEAYEQQLAFNASINDVNIARGPIFQENQNAWNGIMALVNNQMAADLAYLTQYNNPSILTQYKADIANAPNGALSTDVSIANMELFAGISARSAIQTDQHYIALNASIAASLANLNQLSTNASVSIIHRRARLAQKKICNLCL